LQGALLIAINLYSGSK